MRRVLDWIVTFPFLLGFGLTLAVFDPLQRIARLFGQRPQEIVAGALQRTLLWTFAIAGTRLEVERSPRIHPWTPYLIVSNHQSMFDVPIFGGLLFSNFPKYVSKKSLARWIPSISYNLRRGGNAIIDRNDRGQALDAIRQLGQQVRERGVSAVIYPEGTRARRGELGDFKAGGFLELLEAAPDVAVLPVAIDNSWKLLRNNLLPIPFGTRVHVYMGDPIARQPGEDGVQLLKRLRADISGVLERWRALA